MAKTLATLTHRILVSERETSMVVASQRKASLQIMPRLVRSALSCVGNIQMSKLKANKSTQVLKPPTTQKRRNCIASFARLRFVEAVGATISVDNDIL